LPSARIASITAELRGATPAANGVMKLRSILIIFSGNWCT
jgi:hypothetical protein